MESPMSCNQTLAPAASRVQHSASVDSVPEKEPATILYSAFQKAENKVGGGEGLEGVYGSITRVGTTKVLEVFKQHASLSQGSVVLDIGSGLGRPLLHAILHSGVASTYGIEVDAVKCQKAVPFVQHVVADMESHGLHMPASSLPKFICAPIEKVPSLEPATHVYAAWEGFSRDAMQAIGKLFAASRTAQAITIVQRSFRQRDAALEMGELGFGNLSLAAEMPVHMAGSSRRLMAYCFVRDPSEPAARRGGKAGPRPGGDLSTMPAFQPEHVIDVLMSQASERARAAGGKGQDATASDAGDDTLGARDSRERGVGGRPGGRAGTRASTRARTAASESNSQASEETTAGVVERRRR